MKPLTEVIHPEIPQYIYNGRQIRTNMVASDPHKLSQLLQNTFAETRTRFSNNLHFKQYKFIFSVYSIMNLLEVDTEQSVRGKERTSRPSS